jgi:hypothetical protein
VPDAHNIEWIHKNAEENTGKVTSKSYFLTLPSLNFTFNSNK